MQLAWQWGCGEVVSHLERLGFREGHDDVILTDLAEGLQVQGLQLLRDNYINALIGAGANPLRGSDMQWILTKIDDDSEIHIEGSEHRGTNHHMDLHREESIRHVIVRLIFQQKYEGLAALLDAVHLHTLELWDGNFRLLPSLWLFLISN
eukprot:SAG31_NODE_1531_length_7992_cov_2.794121_6_plen_150_part_00